METLEQIKTLTETLYLEGTKFYNGNKSAGTRARKLSQDLKLEIKKLRTEILEHTKNKKIE